MKFFLLQNLSKSLMSPPARVVWIEILLETVSQKKKSSPPARVVWIEISKTWPVLQDIMVATREGGVD